MIDDIFGVESVRVVGELAKTEIAGILERKTHNEKGKRVLRIPEAVEKVSSLTLTLAGKVEISCFSDEALKAADTALKWARERKEIHAPFKYFCKVAYSYSAEKGIPLDYKLRDNLREHYQITDGMQKEYRVTAGQMRFDREARHA